MRAGSASVELPLLACATTLALLACSESSAPSGYVITSVSFAQLFRGDSVMVRAQSRDAADQPTDPIPSVQSLAPALVTVRVDEGQTARPVPELVFWIHAAGVGRGDVAVFDDWGDTVRIAVQTFPNEFDGTISPMSGDFADLIAVTPGSIPWDGDEWVSIGGVAANWVDEQSATMILTRIPGLPALGVHEVMVHDQGPLQITLGGPTIDVTSLFMPHQTPPGSNITAGPFPQSFFIQLHEKGPGDYYYIEPAEELTLRVSLAWKVADTDLDIYPLDCFTGDTLTMDAAWWYNNPEILVDTVSAGGCRIYHFHMYNGSRDTSATAEVTFQLP